MGPSPLPTPTYLTTPQPDPEIRGTEPRAFPELPLLPLGG